MEDILHQLIGSLSHYLHGFIHHRWCRISSINSRFKISHLLILYVNFLGMSPSTWDLTSFSPPPPLAMIQSATTPSDFSIKLGWKTPWREKTVALIFCAASWYCFSWADKINGEKKNKTKGVGACQRPSEWRGSQIKNQSQRLKVSKRQIFLLYPCELSWKRTPFSSERIRLLASGQGAIQ